MADLAPMMNFVSALMKRRGPPRPTGRPKRTSTLADLAPLPKGMQTVNTARAKLPQLATIAGKL